MKMKKNNNPLYYLQPGKQTKITDPIRKISRYIKGNNLKYIENTYKWIKVNISYNKSPDFKSKIFRKRTASQIIEDEFSTGCTDTTLVFISLCRARGIPTKYIEAVKKDSDGSRGHVFAECFTRNRWFTVDPTNLWFKKNYTYKDYDVVAVGLDSIDVETNSFAKIITRTKKFRERKYN